VRSLPVDNLGHFLGGQIGATELLAFVAVDLQIDQSWRDPGPVRRAGNIPHRGRAQVDDPSTDNLQLHELARQIMPADDLHNVTSLASDWASN
jgi:hypothetical protein